MAKLNLADISDTPGFDVTVNANNALIEAAIENTLSRDGTQPNQLDTELDMNSFRINNLADGIDQQDAVTIAQLIGASIAGPVSIDALIDVDLTGILVGDILQWDGIQFLPVTLVLPIQATETSLGIAELATQAEANTGTDDLRIITPLKLANMTNLIQATEVIRGAAEIATQSQTNSGSNDDTIVTPQKLAGRTATTSRTGVIELATQTEVNDGVDAVRAVTPATLAASAASARSFSGCVLARATFHTSGHTTVDLSWDGTGGINPGELPIPFTSETIDTGVADFGTEFHSTSANISRITIPNGVSIVRLTGQVQWDLFEQNSSGAWFMRIIKNGAHFGTVDPGMGDYFPMVHGLFFGGFADANGDGRMAHVVTTVPINVSPGDFFELTTMSQGSDSGILRIAAGTAAFSCEVLE